MGKIGLLFYLVHFFLVLCIRHGMPLTKKNEGNIICLNVYYFHPIFLCGRSGLDSQTHLSIIKMEGRNNSIIGFLCVYISKHGISIVC